MRGGRLEVPWPAGVQAQVDLLPAALRRRLAIRRRLIRLSLAVAGATLLGAAAMAAAHLRPFP